MLLHPLWNAWKGDQREEQELDENNIHEVDGIYLLERPKKKMLWSMSSFMLLVLDHFYFDGSIF